MEQQQKGGCAVCGDDGIPLQVDHCHDTGDVRGLLCFNCNTAIGKFKDDPLLLISAMQYLHLSKRR